MVDLRAHMDYGAKMAFRMMKEGKFFHTIIGHNSTNAVVINTYYNSEQEMFIMMNAVKMNFLIHDVTSYVSMNENSMVDLETKEEKDCLLVVGVSEDEKIAAAY